MAVYEYRALDVDRSAVSGTIVADSPRQARDLLREKGLTVAETRCVRRRSGAVLAARRRRSAEGQVVALIRELATLLATGIPLHSALNVLARQHGGRMRAVIQHLIDRVAAGSSLAEAMADRPECFDELSVSIVGVGESTGDLDDALARLADFKERTRQLRSRVVTALLYPAVVCVIGLAVCVFLMTHVVPNLLDTLVQAGRELPLATRVVKAASDFLIGWWWALLAAAGALAVGVKLLARSEAGALAADRLVLRIPVIGDLIRRECTSRMAVVMAGLLESGLQFVEAVRITRSTMRNSVFRNAMADYERAVSAGSDVAAPLERSGVFSPMVVEILAVGQQSGRLEEMLRRLGKDCEQQVATATARATALLEPLLIVVLAVFVGFIALATILPILEVSDVL